MKTRFFCFLLTMLISASCFAAKYRVFSITKGTTATVVNNINIRGKINSTKTTLRNVGQEFYCNDPAKDVIPNLDGCIEVIEAVSGVTTVYKNCRANNTISNYSAKIGGAKRHEWDNFALNGGDFILTQSLSHDLSAFADVNQQGVMRNHSATMRNAQIQKAKTPVNQLPNNTKVLDKAATKIRQ